MGSPGAGHHRNTDETKCAVPHETPAHPAASPLPTNRSSLTATAQLEPWQGGPHGRSRTDRGPARRTYPVRPSGRLGQPFSRVVGLGAAIVVVIAVAFVTGLVKLSKLSQVTTGVIVAASVAYFVVMLTNSKVATIERTRVRAFIPLFIANAVFWSLFQQIFTVPAVYSDERMNWSIFGWTAPANWIGSIEPVWIIVLSPLFANMWTRQGNRAPTTPRKFAYGVIGMGLAFLLFLPMFGTTGKAVPALLVVGIMAVFALSELLLSPIGLSVTTKLAPEAFRAQMMALYFFSVGLGTSMSGVLARYYDPAHEFAYFGIIGAVAVFAGIVVFAIPPWISRLMEGVH